MRIVKMLREAGAKEVHVRIASSPLRNPCYYGVDIKSREELISAQQPLEEVRKMIEADSLAFLSEQGMMAAGNCEDLCLACFNGRYPTKLHEQ